MTKRQFGSKRRTSPVKHLGHGFETISADRVLINMAVKQNGSEARPHTFLYFKITQSRKQKSSRNQNSLLLCLHSGNGHRWRWTQNEFLSVQRQFLLPLTHCAAHTSRVVWAAVVPYWPSIQTSLIYFTFSFMSIGFLLGGQTCHQLHFVVVVESP